MPRKRTVPVMALYPMDGVEAPPVQGAKRLAVRNLSHAVRAKRILHEISILVQGGEMVLVLGASGSGKTSFLRSLYCARTHGSPQSVIVYGQKVADQRRIQKHAMFLSDNDELLPHLTVYETLLHASQLHTPRMSKSVRASRIEEVLAQLQLGPVRNTPIGNEWGKYLSTGEKRRVALGIVLLSEANVILADECLTGLDSTSASIISHQLQSLTLKKGKTVILTAHRASSQLWQIANKVLYILKGECIFFGPSLLARPYFASIGYPIPEQCCPAEFIDFLATSASNSFSKGLLSQLGFASGPPAGVLAKAFKSSFVYRDLMTDINRELSYSRESAIPSLDSAKVNFKVLWKSCLYVDRVWILTKRLFKNTLRNPLAYVTILVAQVIQACIFGELFYGLHRVVSVKYEPSYDLSNAFRNEMVQRILSGSPGVFSPQVKREGGEASPERPEALLEGFEAAGQSLYGVYDFLLCALRKVSGYLRDYYHYATRPLPALGPEPTSKFEDLNATVVAGEIVTALQYVDLLYQGLNWTQYTTIRNDSLAFYLKLMTERDGFFLTPFMTCPNYAAPTELEGTSSRAAKRRQLISIDQLDFDVLLNVLLSSQGMRYIETAVNYVKKITSCSAVSCQWLNALYAPIEQFALDYYDSTMVVVTMLSSFFVLIANVGFYSYDALLMPAHESRLLSQEVERKMYTLSAYCVAKTIVGLVFQLCPVIVSASIFYILAGFLVSFSQYAIFVLIVVASTFSAYGLGTAISAWSPRLEIGMVVAPILLLLWIVSSGFVIGETALPKAFIYFSYTGFHKWAYAAFVLNQFEPGSYVGTLPHSLIRYVAAVDQVSLWSSIFYIIGLGIFYRLIALAGLFCMKRLKF